MAVTHDYVAVPKTLLDIRKLFCSYSGDFEMVVDTTDWQDAGVDHFINLGQRFLEDYFYTPFGNEKLYLHVPVGVYQVIIPRLKEVRTAWWYDSDGDRSQLSRKTEERLRSGYEDDFEDVDPDDALYYAVNIIRGEDESLFTHELLTDPTFLDTTKWTVTGNGGLDYPNAGAGWAYNAQGFFYTNSVVVDYPLATLPNAGAFQAEADWVNPGDAFDTQVVRVALDAKIDQGNIGFNCHDADYDLWTASPYPIPVADGIRQKHQYQFTTSAAFATKVAASVSDFQGALYGLSVRLLRAAIAPSDARELQTIDGQTGILLMPPSDGAGYVEVWCDRYSAPLTSDYDTSFWTVHNPYALLYASLRAREISRRNVEASLEWERPMKEMLDTMINAQKNNQAPESGELVMEVTRADLEARTHVRA